MILNYLSLQVPKINYSVYPQIITTTKKKKKLLLFIELLEEKALNTMTTLNKLKLPEVTETTLRPE